MILNGVWVGLGPGDRSPEIAKIKKFMREKFRLYAGHLNDDDFYSGTLDDAVNAPTMTGAVKEMQRRYGLRPTGIIGASLKERMGYWKPDLPILFTVEGHMSSEWVGPCAVVAQTLEQQGVCKWQPIRYNNKRLPFDNDSGVSELHRLVTATKLDNGTPFPLGTPWGMVIFSQGGIVGSRFYKERLRPENGTAHHRLKDLKGVVAFGNPYREKDVIADWVPDPPKRGTQGISDDRMDHTPTWWKEHSRKGDLYAENTDDNKGEHKTAVYKMVQNQWSGRDSIIEQLLEMGLNPTKELIAVALACISGVGFLVNMGPHGIYDLGPPIEHMRRSLTR